MSIGEFAEQHLFGPLGIMDYGWSNYPDGTVEADGGLALRPRDLAKIGLMVLDNGLWQGETVVSEKWLDHATEGRFVYSTLGGEPVSYGSFWNQMVLPTPDGSVTTLFHGGTGGNFLTVIPDLEMVVVFTAAIYGRDPKRLYYPVLAEYILAGIDRSTGR
jgi:CubicO group peptidase (beta-lactamase class C family)